MNNKTDCRRFENCEFVISGLLNGEEQMRKNVQDCLFLLYGDDCAKWLVNKFGPRKKEGMDHNAYHAFNDALMALESSISQKRFGTMGRQNACRTFLYSVAKRCYIRLRSRNTPEIVDIVEAENSPLYPKPDYVYPFEEDEKRRALHEAILNMPEKCREILWLRWVEGVKIKEIAEKMGVEKERVTRWLFDCRNRFKKILPANFKENY